MKHNLAFIGLLSLMAASCSFDETVRPDVVADDTGMVFYATIDEQYGAETKVFADTSLRILWNAGDCVSIFNKDSGNDQYIFAGSTGSNSGAFDPGTEYSGQRFQLDAIYSVYPYRDETAIEQDGIISLSLPEVQRYSEGSFGLGANTMVSVTDDNNLKFKNVCGYLALKFYGEDIDVSSIVLTGNKGEPLSGEGTVEMSVGGLPSLVLDESAGEAITLTCEPAVRIGTSADKATVFWFVVPPVTFSNGFTVTLTTIDGNVFKKSTFKECTIGRSAVTRFQALKAVPHTPYYSSADYSKDGEVVQLQQATEGRGINIIFLGDGFVDTDMAEGGRYDRKMNQAMEQFFSYEPYTTFRDRFNVYTVRVVSENAEYTEDSNRRLTYYKTDGMAMRATLCTEYAERIPNPYNLPLKIGVIANTEERVFRSVCGFKYDGWCCGFVFDKIGNVLNHEIGGHGFANLFDEYVEKAEVFADTDGLDNDFTHFGFGANVDWRNDPLTVRWSSFLNDEKYSAEGLGLYEGAHLYRQGIYRATENSMMRYNDTPFNAPSREQIYKTIMKYSEGDSWTYDYEAFVAVDEAGRNQAASAFAVRTVQSSVLRAPSRSELPLPPVLLDQDVKVIVVDGNGKVEMYR
ncbi:MAG: hypothetical protein J5382_06950 [Bacteroidales bacterium]|nr:hypothetical protein [Bacteroidales bacterium]